jgi:hypothetical protein
MGNSQGKKQGLRGVRLYLILFGALFLGIGGWFYLDQHGFEAKAEKATGTVIDVKRHKTTSTTGGRQRTSIVYRPVIRFEVGGKSYTFTSGSASSDYNYKKGVRLDILYDPANPQEARLADNLVSLIAILMIGVGGLILMAGLCLPLVYKK